MRLTKKILHYVQNDSKCKYSVYRNEYAPAILLNCRGVCYYVSEKCRLGDGDKEDPVWREPDFSPVTVHRGGRNVECCGLAVGTGDTVALRVGCLDDELQVGHIGGASTPASRLLPVSSQKTDSPPLPPLPWTSRSTMPPSTVLPALQRRRSSSATTWSTVRPARSPVPFWPSASGLPANSRTIPV